MKGKGSNMSKDPRYMSYEHGTEIAFQKVTIIGRAIIGEGDSDVMSAFFAAVESDCRDQMRAEYSTTDDYMMVDQLGETKITVTHTPHPAPLSAAEQRKADREAAREAKRLANNTEDWPSRESIN
jgi:hypothetical protein